MKTPSRIFLLVAAVAFTAACGSGSSGTTGAVTPPPPPGGSGGSSTGGGGAIGAIGADGCSDLFDQKTLQTYSVDISGDEWTKISAEFQDVAAVLANTPRETYHPVTFHFGTETVSDAAIRLKGQSSWVDTVMYDASPKMQFVIAFDQVNPNGKFHGLGKITLDMPRADWTFLNERIANNWLRKIGIMAPCANSARLNINGAFYGLYVSEESKDHSLVKEFFPGNSDGDLLKSANEPQTNKTSTNWNRVQQFKDANSIGAMQAIVDIPGSVLEWAAEALLNDADGYYGGSHNFFIYDQGAKGYVWLPTDVDTTIEWMSVFTSLGYRQHPIFWWEERPFPQPPGQHYLLVMNDPASRKLYVDALETQIGKFDGGEISGWIDAWSAQVADAVAADPHKWATTDGFKMAVAQAKDTVANRPGYLQSFVMCERGQGGDDQDHDGVPWCNDCRDDDASVHPGATEVCNGKDDDCNGVVDDGCPAPPMPPPGAM